MELIKQLDEQVRTEMDQDTFNRLYTLRLRMFMIISVGKLAMLKC